MAKCKVTCSVDGEIIVDAQHVLLDTEESRYRLQCTGPCGRVLEKRMDDEIFGILRGAGSPTIDDLCMSFAALLDDDRNLARFIYSP